MKYGAGFYVGDSNAVSLWKVVLVEALWKELANSYSEYWLLFVKRIIFPCRVDGFNDNQPVANSLVGLK